MKNERKKGTKRKGLYIYVCIYIYKGEEEKEEYN
jgi:hypothetical protein